MIAPPRPEPVRLTLVPLPDAIPADQRLKLLLKVALRRFRLKCLAVEPVRGPAAGTTDHPDATPERPAGERSGIATARGPSRPQMSAEERR